MLGACATLALNSGLQAQDPYEAEEIAYRMAMKQGARGYLVAPVQSDVATQGQIIKVAIPVTAGLDYVVLVGGDNNAQNIDVILMSEQKTRIKADKRSPRSGGKDAGVRWRSTYSGTAYAYVQIISAYDLAAYAVLVGKRGDSNEDPGSSQLEKAPAHLDSTQPAAMLAEARPIPVRGRKEPS